MTDDDLPCPICAESHAAIYEAQNGLYRLWCAYCGHSTDGYAHINLARREWLGGRDEADPG